MFDNLPQEVVWYILDYLSLDQIVKLGAAAADNFQTLLTIFYYLQKVRLAGQVPGSTQYMDVLQAQLKIVAAMEAYYKKLIQQQSGATSL